MRCVLAALAVIALVASSSQSQEKIAPDNQRPMLMVREGAVSKPLALASADIHVLVSGFSAQTTMTLTFHNDNSRVVEGELIFPLPEGATVSGYGLDVNGEMVDGVPVEKHQARITFETEVRKGVDPGLVEHVKGNNFRTRIYPIPANGERTVKVQYLSELAHRGDGLAYVLPMNWGEQPVGRYSVKVEMIAPPGEPALAGGAAKDLSLAKAAGRLAAQKTYQNAHFADDLTITIAQVPARHAVIERFQPEGAAAPGNYFVINDLPAVPANLPGAVKPAYIGILWDASLSRAGDHQREIELLKQFLARSPVAVDLIIFRNKAEAPVSFAAGQADQLIRAIEAVQYDGGTNLGQLDIFRSHNQYSANRDESKRMPNYDYWLLFTDGLGNLFGDAPREVQAPVYAISDDSRSDHALLAHLARSSGGDYYNLKRLADEQVLSAIGRPAFSLLRAEFDAGQIADVYPRGVTPVQGRVAVAGRLLADEATITLHYGVGMQEMGQSTYTLKAADAATGALAARAWAQQKAADLSVFAEKNHDELLRVGQEFGIVTPSTSLMVLERLEQYVQYKITPPRSRPDVYAAYVKEMANRTTAEKKAGDDKVEAVAKMWEARVQWWEAKHEYARDFRYIAPEKDKPAVTAAMPQGGNGGPATQPADVASALSRRVDPTGVRSITGHAIQPASPAPLVAEPSPAPNRPLAPGQNEAGLASGLEEWGAIALDADHGGVGDGTVSASGGGGLGVRFSAAAGGRAGAGIVQTGSAIAIREWNPETPYLILLKNAPAEKAYDLYLAQRKEFGTGPSFYLDCADFFIRSNRPDLGMRILTDIPELQLESAPLLRVAAHRLQQLGQLELAIDLFEKVLKMRPEEPQSYRDLALAISQRADSSGAASESVRADYARAIDLLNKVVMGRWDNRFPEIEVVALMEINRLIAKAKAIDPAIAIPLDPRLARLLDVDLRIVLTWDADATDIDLWVVEPSGEKCFYEHTRTTIGGLISKDFTQGYGPEEYCLRRAMPGQYKIQANFYGSRQQKLAGPTTVQATVITNFGRADEKRQSLTLRLVGQKEVVDVGEVTVAGK